MLFYFFFVYLIKIARMCDSINCFKQRNDMRLKSENVLTIYGWD